MEDSIREYFILLQLCNIKSSDTGQVQTNKLTMHKALHDMSPDSREEAKVYIFKNEIPQLFESLTAGLLHHRPEHPVEFVQDCLDSVRPPPGQPNPSVRWASFIDWRPAPNSRSVSRMIESHSAKPRAKSRASTADSGFRDVSSASTTGRTTSLSASSRGRVQMTPEVPAEKPISDDIATSGGASPDTPQTLAPQAEGGDRPGTGKVSIIDDPVAEEPEDDGFDPTEFEPPTM